MNLNFKMREFLRSDTATKNNISNLPDADSLDNLLNLIVFVMQPFREYLGKPIIITSGYRCPKLNKMVGGVPTSQHTKGQACDFVINGMTIEQVIYAVKKSNIEYDQLINEHNQWVHISYNRGHNRKQFIVL